MENYALTKNKLYILFVLDLLDFPLSNSQLTECILKHEYTNYFKLQTFISELENDGFITVKKDKNKTYYSLSASGKNILDLFESRVSLEIKEELISYTMANEERFRAENEYAASYEINERGDCILHLTTKDQDTLYMDIKINVFNQENAQASLSLWSKKSDEIYLYLLSQLTKDDEELEK